MMGKLDEFFQSKVEIRAIRYGRTQAIDTLVSEEVLLLAKYLRGESETFNPRAREHGFYTSTSSSTRAVDEWISARIDLQ